MMNAKAKGIIPMPHSSQFPQPPEADLDLILPTLEFCRNGIVQYVLFIPGF